MTKKLLLTTSLFILLVLTAAAQDQADNNRFTWNDRTLDILLDMRADGKFSTGNPDGKHLGFEDQTLKIVMRGEIIPGIRYRLRHRLNKVQQPLRDNLSSATDHAWLEFDLGRQKHWTLVVGKQSVQFGTFEYDYNPADVYMGTMCFNDLDSYKTGVNAIYRIKEQIFNFQVVNSDEPQFASHEYRNKSLAFNFLWQGSLFDGTLKTRWGYGIFMHDKSKFHNWITPGIQLNINKFTTELDYYFGERSIDYSSVIDIENIGLNFVKDQSLSLNLKYDFGKWNPSLKGTWNQRHDKEIRETAYQTFGIQAALEFYPFKHKYLKDLRLHAVYYYNDTDFKGPYNNMKNKGAHTALIGIRWLFKAM